MGRSFIYSQGHEPQRHEDGADDGGQEGDPHEEDEHDVEVAAVLVGLVHGVLHDPGERNGTKNVKNKKK